jgi:hypothetical protein
MRHTLTDDRHGPVVNAMVMLADGFAECEAANVEIPQPPSSVRSMTSARLVLQQPVKPAVLERQERNERVVLESTDLLQELPVVGCVQRHADPTT